MQWSNRLYAGEKVIEDAETIIREIDEGRIRRGICLITLPSNPQNRMDLVYLHQIPGLQVQLDRMPKVIGLASGREEAIRVAARILRECFLARGNCDVSAFVGEGNKCT